MPFYVVEQLKESRPGDDPVTPFDRVPGELMKAAVVTKLDGEGPSLHMHPNEEQWTLILDGKLHYVLGDEEKIVERGDLIHIPRFTNHRSRAIGGTAVFFTVKSPVGKGDMAEDYNKAEDGAADKAEEMYTDKAEGGV